MPLQCGHFTIEIRMRNNMGCDSISKLSRSFMVLTKHIRSLSVLGAEAFVVLEDCSNVQENLLASLSMFEQPSLPTRVKSLLFLKVFQIRQPQCHLSTSLESSRCWPEQPLHWL